jgi:hypothetical protein
MMEYKQGRVCSRGGRGGLEVNETKGNEKKVGKESGRGRKGKREIGQERGLWKKSL